MLVDAGFLSADRPAQKKLPLKYMETDSNGSKMLNISTTASESLIQSASVDERPNTSSISKGEISI